MGRDFDGDVLQLAEEAGGRRRAREVIGSLAGLE
jgi:hypothetical protein